MTGPARRFPYIRNYDLDEDLLEEAARKGRPAMKLYAWKGLALVLGRGSDPEREIRLEPALADGVPILRRRGGGCAVLLDPGNAVASLAFPLPGTGRITRAFDASLEWLLGGLERAGIYGIRREGISDLALGEKKVGGTCLYRKSGLVYFSATLLAAPSLELVERYLKHPPREPAWRRGRSHAAFMGSLLSPPDAPEMEGFLRRLRPALEKSLPPVFL